MKYEIIKGSEKDFEKVDKVDNRNVLTHIYKDESGVFYSSMEIEHISKLRLVAERRPITEPVWDGEGLMPPVGLLVEYKLANRKYRSDFSKGTVLFYGEQNWLIKHWSSGNEFLEPVGGIEFRPIRSPEDVARDEAIDSIQAKLLLRREVAIDFYDAIAAGKIKGVLTLSSLEELVAKGHYQNLVINK